MGASHDHDHGVGLARAGAKHKHRLFFAFLIIAAFFVLEVIAGFWTNSLALLSDAGHMFTDVLGIGMALAAIQLASRFGAQKATPQSGQPNSAPAVTSHTFGLYRLEILAAFVNALLLFAVAIWVLIEAGRRLFSEPEVLTNQMLIVAGLGLLANIAAFLLLRQGAKESLNVEGAYLEVLADLIGSVGVIIAAIAISVFGWSWIDPVVAALIGLWILPRTWHLGRKAVRILLQAAPENVDLVSLADDLGSIAGVTNVHDLHVWTLTSEMDAVSAHLMTEENIDSHSVLDRARSIMTGQYGIEHATFQIEPESHIGCHEVSW